MNPRYRRLLIPGLLIALLVIVVVSSVARRADGAEVRPGPVSRITDLLGPRAQVLRPEVLDGIRDLRLRVRPPETDPEPGTPAEKADVFGEIEIRFRTEP